MGVDKTRNSKTWTEACFRSFITSILRGATYKWGPINKVRKRANIRWGWYKCCGYKRQPHEVPATVTKGKKKFKNALVDHIHPVVDPVSGFSSWDDYIKRMFVEEDGLQLLCKACHDLKTSDEKHIRKKSK